MHIYRYNFTFLNRFFFFLLLIFVPLLRAMDDSEKTSLLTKWFGPHAPKAELGLTLLGIGAIALTASHLQGGPVSHLLANKTNLGYTEIQTAVAVTGGLLAFSCIGESRSAAAARSIALRIPLYTGLIAFIYSRGFQNAVSYMPLIGTPLAQDNKVAKGLLLLGTGILLHHGCNKIGAYMRARISQDSMTQSDT